MSERLPLVFTQEEMDQMENKPFDVYDNKLRARMSEHQSVLNQIAERESAREAARKKWINPE